MLDIVLKHARAAGATRVTRVNLVIGGLTGIVDESVQMYFDLLSENTLAAGAELCFRYVEPRFRCRDCGTEFTANDYEWVCPQCGAIGGEVVAGQEFLVESIEVCQKADRAEQEDART